MHTIDNTLNNIDINQLKRDANFNTSKSNFGTVGIIGGASGMFGAPLLSGRSALITGCGKVIIGFVAENYPQVDFSTPELMSNHYQYVLNLIHKLDALVIGVGLGISHLSEEILYQIVNYSHLNCKLIFDADALNLVAQNKDLAIKFTRLANKIITPHPLEAARLLSISVEEIQNNRISAIKALQNQFNCVVVLKGYQSLITDGHTIYENHTGTSALSNAGQGDVLCGVIASFTAQGMDIYTATRFAVYLHGLSSDDLVKVYGGYNGIIATDTLTNIRRQLNYILYYSSFN